MKVKHIDEKAVFNTARKIPDAGARESYLELVCSDDPEAKQRIRDLLRVHCEEQSFLESPPPGIDRTQGMPPVTEQPGDTVGLYKLREQIGEGGFGVVYVAEQQQPVARKVALKIIKPGMDSKDVIARFEAERQTLALMDHPNVATVLDAGTTESGRPYFVMELICGVPITEFCDRHKLSIDERLKLFVEVCRAVQHAHQKGIIHRDLKPSNVMVTLDDDRPIPKVIDFGISKTLSRKLTDKTVYTAYGQMIGTPLYMAPEQAQMSMRDVDTRSDVYSLGVLLFELLTGTTPFDTETFKKADFDELRRIIREDEPPRPSARVSTLNAEALSTISHKRKIDARTLSRSLRGELDWIVMKPLEKDRNRRYESASALAADIERFLADEPVQACPPSLWYQFRKFAHRRMVALTIGTLILMLVVSLGSGIGWVVRDRAAREHEAARERTVRRTRLATRVEVILADAHQRMTEQEWPEAVSVAKRAEALISGGDADEETRRCVRDLLNDLKMMERLEKARQRKSGWTVTQFDYAGAAEGFAAAFGDYGIALADLQTKVAAARLRSRPELVLVFVAALDDWAGCLNQLSNRSDGRKLLELADAVDPHPWRSRVRAALLRTDSDNKRDAMLKQLAAAAPVRKLAASSFWQLASELRIRGCLREAIGLLKRAQSAHPGDFWINYDLATYCHDAQGTESARDAVTFYRVALAIRPGHSATLSGLGLALRAVEKLDEAVDCYEQAIESDPRFAPAWFNLGVALEARNNLDRAIECYKTAIACAPTRSLPYRNLGKALRKKGRLDDAVSAFEKSIALDSQDAVAHNNLGITLIESKAFEQAIDHLQRAIEIDSQYAIAHNNLGNALMAMQRIEGAADAYRQAIVLDSRLVAAHYNLGNALLALGDLDGAIVRWKEAVGIAPTSIRPECIQSYNHLGVAMARKGDCDDAIDYWRQSIQLNPENTRIRFYLATMLLTRARESAKKGAVQHVINDCDEVLKLTADTPDDDLKRLRQESARLRVEISDGKPKAMPPASKSAADMKN